MNETALAVATKNNFKKVTELHAQTLTPAHTHTNARAHTHTHIHTQTHTQVIKLLKEKGGI